MDQENMTATQMAQKQCEQDALFRRAVDVAVHEAMAHFDHIESEAERRDLQHATVVAARAAIRTVIDGDRYLKAMEFERDAAKKMALDMAKVTPGYRVYANAPFPD